MCCLVQGAAAAVGVSALPPTSAVQHVLRIQGVMNHCESQSEVLEIVDAPWNFPVDTRLSCLPPSSKLCCLPLSPSEELQLRQEGRRDYVVALERWGHLSIKSHVYHHRMFFHRHVEGTKEKEDWRAKRKEREEQERKSKIEVKMRKSEVNKLGN